jgi:uncharacterized protein (UPF0212 family)
VIHYPSSDPQIAGFYFINPAFGVNGHPNMLLEVERPTNCPCIDFAEVVRRLGEEPPVLEWGYRGRYAESEILIRDYILNVLIGADYIDNLTFTVVISNWFPPPPPAIQMRQFFLEYPDPVHHYRNHVITDILERCNPAGVGCQPGETRVTTAPSCDVEGRGDVLCAICSVVYSANVVIPVSCNFGDDGICTECGEFETVFAAAVALVLALDLQAFKCESELDAQWRIQAKVIGVLEEANIVLDEVRVRWYSEDDSFWLMCHVRGNNNVRLTVERDVLCDDSDCPTCAPPPPPPLKMPHTITMSEFSQVMFFLLIPGSPLDAELEDMLDRRTGENINLSGAELASAFLLSRSSPIENPW